jgi:hypothetical protein
MQFKVANEGNQGSQLWLRLLPTSFNKIKIQQKYKGLRIAGDLTA